MVSSIVLAPRTLTPVSSLLRCLRGPHLSPLPLTPVGPEGLGQPRLFVPGNTWVKSGGRLRSRAGAEGSLPGYPLRGGQAQTQSPQPPPCPRPRHPCAPFTDLAATPPGKSICKGGQSGGAPSLQGPLLSLLARPTPVGNGVVPLLTPTLTSATCLPW